MRTKLRKLNEAKMARLENIALMQLQIPPMKVLAYELGISKSHVINVLYHLRRQLRVSRESYRDTSGDSANRIRSA